MLDCLHYCIQRRQLLERGTSSSVVAQMVPRKLLVATFSDLHIQKES